MDDSWRTATGLLGAAATLIDGIQQGMAERGFDDVRPMHGFAFARLAAGDAGVVALAEHLGVTKQAAGQLADQLEARGYLTRRPDPYDGRAKVLVLTARGRRCTRAAEDAIADVVAEWRTRGVDTDRLAQMLAPVAGSGPLRPAW